FSETTFSALVFPTDATQPPKLRIRLARFDNPGWFSTLRTRLAFKCLKLTHPFLKLQNLILEIYVVFLKLKRGFTQLHNLLLSLYRCPLLQKVNNVLVAWKCHGVS